MEIFWWHYLLVFGVGCLASFVNSLAGGGSTLTLPLLIFLGLPPTVANGTNRFAIFCGNVSSLAGLRKGGYFHGGMLKLLWLPTTLGALVGSFIGVGVSDRVFQIVLAITMVLVVILSNLRPGILGKPPAEVPTRLAPHLFVVFFVVGVYGGFIQVGVGFIQILALSRFSGLDLLRVNALKNALAILFIALSSLIFSLGGLVVWPLALVQAAGALLGGWLGSVLQMRKGEVLVRRAVALTSLLLACKLIYDAI